MLTGFENKQVQRLSMKENLHKYIISTNNPLQTTVINQEVNKHRSIETTSAPLQTFTSENMISNQVQTKWILLDDKTTSSKLKLESKNQALNYHLSFGNISVQLISALPYPDKIHCQFFNNLKVNSTQRLQSLKNI